MKIENETVVNFKKAFNNITTKDDGKLNERLSMLSPSYISMMQIASSIIDDNEVNEFGDIDEEKILNLQRAGFDVFIRNCGMVDSLIFNECNQDEIKYYIEFRAASVRLYHKRNIPNPTGQLGLDTRFVDGLREALKNKGEFNK